VFCSRVRSAPFNNIIYTYSIAAYLGFIRLDYTVCILKEMSTVVFSQREQNITMNGKISYGVSEFAEFSCEFSSLFLVRGLKSLKKLLLRFSSKKSVAKQTSKIRRKYQKGTVRIMSSSCAFNVYHGFFGRINHTLFAPTVLY
jgi:hypothetical protein